MTPSAVTRLLARIEELEGKATPGVYYVTDVGTGEIYVRSKTPNANYPVCETWGGYGPNRNDADFLAELRNACLTLIAVARIRGEALDECEYWLRYAKYDVPDAQKAAFETWTKAREAQARAERLAKGET